jgi:hypothetical protein
LNLPLDEFGAVDFNYVQNHAGKVTMNFCVFPSMESGGRSSNSGVMQSQTSVPGYRCTPDRNELTLGGQSVYQSVKLLKHESQSKSNNG